MEEYSVSEIRKQSDIREKIIYQIMFRTFTVKGTIASATRRLKHVADLGVDIIYLSPFCEADGDMDRSAWSERQIASGMNNPKNPYRICDYFKIDEEYGTDEDLTQFMREAHDLGLKVIFDLVYMHCGPSKFVQNHPTFVQRDATGAVLSSRYNFPYLDYNNPQLCEYMWSNMLYWVEKFDVDGYRCDVGDEVPLEFWREGRRRIEQIKPKFYFINEGENPDYMLEVFDVAYYNHDFSWNEVIQKTLKKGNRGVHHSIRMIYEALKARNPDGALLLRAYENHDFVVDSWDSRLDKTHPKAVEALMVLNFVIDGVPMLYSGNEFADSRRHTMWRWSGDDYCVDWNVISTSEGQRRMELTKKLCDLRHTYKALCRGDTRLEKTPDLLIFKRQYGDEIIKAVFRFEAPSVEYIDVEGDVLLCGNCRMREQGVILDEGGYIVERIKK